MERHRELCADAVDPLDVAEVLERSGIGPATAGRYRHADVFSLAEEMYAREPRRAVAPVRGAGPWRRRTRPALLAGCPLLAAALLLWGLAAGLGVQVPLAARVAVLTLGAAPAVLLGRGPRPWQRALLALGLGTVLALVPRLGPPQAALAASVGVADWGARWFRHIGRRHALARSSKEFRSRMRPVLPATAGLFLVLLLGLTLAVGAVAGAVSEAGAGTGARSGPAASVAWSTQVPAGAGLLVTLLLWHCGRHRAALAALAACCLCAGITHVIPAPVDAAGWACALTAALLLPCAWVTLLSPTSHRAPGDPAPPGAQDVGRHPSTQAPGPELS